MRKTLLLTIALLFSATIFAQSRSIILRETFDSSSLPEGWTTSDPGSGNWIISETNKAGGEASELKLNPTPQSVGVIRIITKPVDLSGLSKVTLSLRHYFEKKSISGTVGVATSSTNGNSWSQAWSKTYSEEDRYTIVEDISNNDMGKSNVLFCIYFQGNTNNVNGWYFDDFEISVMEENDAKFESINIADFIPAGKQDVNFSVQNNGTEEITSFEATYQVNDITVTETFETSLATFETGDFSFEEKMYLTPGSYNIEININSVNGNEDQNTTNNKQNKDLNVALGGTQKIPMIEHFSSSTCASCVPLNATMLELTENNPGKYTYTKYAMNFPSYGDDYYTAEAGARKNYYDVTGVPHICFNGGNHEYHPVTQEELDEDYNTPAFVNIKGAFYLEGNTINIITDVMSYINLSDKKLFVTVNEKTTVENVEAINNADSAFHHIMMKMITGSQGSSIDLNEGEYKHFEFSHDMSTTFVEDINDLEVAVWIQDYDTREIYNSRYLYEYTDHPYPAQNLQMHNENGILNISWEAPEKGNPTGYNLYVNGDLVLENSNEMSYTLANTASYNSAEVVALYEDDKESIALITVQDLSVTEAHETNIAIYPNPAKDFVKLLSANNHISVLKIYNTLGMLIDELKVNSNEVEINISNYNSGIYFIEAISEKGNNIIKIIKE